MELTSAFKSRSAHFGLPVNVARRPPAPLCELRKLSEMTPTPCSSMFDKERLRGKPLEIMYWALACRIGAKAGTVLAQIESSCLIAGSVVPALEQR